MSFPLRDSPQRVQRLARAVPMYDVCIPAIPIPDRTTFAEIGPLCVESMEAMEAGKLQPTPFFFFEVCDTPDWEQEPLLPSPAPERLLCVAASNAARQVLFSALAAVEKREARLPRLKLLRVRIKPNSPLKQIYRQMAETPITVYSLTPSDLEGPSIFFIRGAFTTTELRKELPNHILGSDPGPPGSTGRHSAQ